MYSGVDQADLVVAGGGGHSGVGQGEHVDAVLVGVAGRSDVHAVGNQRDDVTSGRSMDEGKIAESVVGERGGEVVLLCDGGCFDRCGAGHRAIGEQHFLGAADEFAVDDAVADVHGNRLKAAGVGEEVEAAAVACLEDERGGLVGVGYGRRGGVGGGVVDARHREVEGRDLADSGVQRERAASAGELVENPVDVVVEGYRAESAADGGVDGLETDAVDAGVVGGDVAGEGAEGGDAGGAHVAGDERDGAAASATGDADDLVLVGVVGGAGADGQRDAVQGARGGGAGDGRGNGGLSEAAGFQDRAVAGCGAGSAASGQLDAEGAFNADVGEQLLGCAQVRTNQVTVDALALDRRDVEVTDQHGVGAQGRGVGAVGGLDLRQEEALTSEECHRELPGGV